ncbi:hypothetical protein ACWJJH_10215 [Endozoicomonadaceae bacterium StTr2]
MIEGLFYKPPQRQTLETIKRMAMNDLFYTLLTLTAVIAVLFMLLLGWNM